MYFTDNDGTAPPVRDIYNKPIFTSAELTWKDLVYPYIKNGGRPYNNGQPYADKGSGGIFVCPDNQFAWSNAPTPGPSAPASPYDRIAPVGTPAPSASPYSGYTAGPGSFPLPPSVPPAPPVDGHASPSAPPAAVSPTAPDSHVSASPHDAAGSGGFMPMSPAAVIGSAFIRGAAVSRGPGAPTFGPSGLHACPRCGQPAAQGAAYCVACGVPLSPAAYPLEFAGFFRR